LNLVEVTTIYKGIGEI